VLHGRCHFFHAGGGFFQRTGLLFGPLRQVVVARGDFAAGSRHCIGAVLDFLQAFQQPLPKLLHVLAEPAYFILRTAADRLREVTLTQRAQRPRQFGERIHHQTLQRQDDGDAEDHHRAQHAPQQDHQFTPCTGQDFVCRHIRHDGPSQLGHACHTHKSGAVVGCGQWRPRGVQLCGVADCSDRLKPGLGGRVIHVDFGGGVLQPDQLPLCGTGLHVYGVDLPCIAHLERTHFGQDLPFVLVDVGADEQDANHLVAVLDRLVHRHVR